MFRTEFTIPPVDFRLGLSTKFLTLGSCFADVVGNQLQNNKLSTLINPFGTLFNPVSACHLLTQCCQDPKPTDKWVQNQGRWYHYDFHSSFSAPDQSQLALKIENTLKQTHAFLQQTDCILLTLGTAYVYEQKDTKSIVANCHKVPSTYFTRYLLTTDQINEAFAQMHRTVTAIRPDIKFVLTVSPVRHTKDSLPLNQVSKSLLRVSTHQLAEQFENVFYFPSYELMMDDLRDYRFYKADMIHPNEVAETYIWTKFMATYLNEETQNFIKEWEMIQKALTHKPFHPANAAHQHFLKELVHKLEALSDRIEVRQEIAFVKQQIL